MSERWRDRAVVGVSALLAIVALGPALGPGYALTGDMVFVPDQVLLPWMAGIGGGLPRAVPQDIVLALLTGPVPGWVWQSVALVGALVLLGTGVGRLARPAGRRAALVAAAVSVWSPFVAERLLIGHWSLLLAVGLLPWALVHARACRDGVPGAAARWLLALAAASLTVTGGLLVLLVSAPVLVWRGGSLDRRRPLVVAGGLVLQLPWLVPALLKGGATGAGGADVFALRAEGPWGALVTALGTGGIWNAAATPASRSTWLAPLLTVVVLVLAWIGRRGASRALGGPTATALVVASAAGLVVALLGAWWPDASAAVVTHLPGGGLLRDGQKWLAPWVVLLSVSAGCGAARAGAGASRRWREPAVGSALVAAVLVLPLACLPDLAWGALGRLATTPYPDDWVRVRSALAAQPADGDAVSLPWSTYRVFPWNHGRTVLDPAPRFMTRTVVTSSDLPVRHDGEIVVVPGDDPRSLAVGRALAAPDPVAGLRAQGIAYAIVAHGVGQEPVLQGATPVVQGIDLDLYRLGPSAPLPESSGAGLVVLANLAALVVVLAGAVTQARARRPRTGPGRLPTGRVRSTLGEKD